MVCTMGGVGLGWGGGRVSLENLFLAGMQSEQNWFTLKSLISNLTQTKASETEVTSFATQIQYSRSHNAKRNL